MDYGIINVVYLFYMIAWLQVLDTVNSQKAHATWKVYDGDMNLYPNYYDPADMLNYFSNYSSLIAGFGTCVVSYYMYTE